MTSSSKCLKCLPSLQVRRKMSREEFVKLVPRSQFRSHNDSSDASTSVGSGLFGREVLEAIYDDVLSSEFRVLLSQTDLVGFAVVVCLFYSLSSFQVYGRLSKLPNNHPAPALQTSPWGPVLETTTSDAGGESLGQIDTNERNVGPEMLLSRPLVKRRDTDDLLKSGATFLKYCRNGSIKFRFVYLSEVIVSLKEDCIIICLSRMGFPYVGVL